MDIFEFMSQNLVVVIIIIMIVIFIIKWATQSRETKFRGGIQISAEMDASKFLIVVLLICVLGLGYFYFLYATSPVQGQMAVAVWKDSNGDGEIQPGEIREQHLDLNPYAIMPQALVKNTGEKFLYIYGNVTYKVDQTVSENFYGIYGILAYKDMKWTWITPRYVQLNGIEATKLSDNSKETLNGANFAEGLKFSSAQAGGPYQSGAVFPYNAYIGGKWYSRVLVLSNGVASTIYHSNHGTTDYSSHTLENWMRNLGLGDGDYQLFFYYAFAKASAVSDGVISKTDELIASPVQSPVSFYVRLSSSSGTTAAQIIGFSVTYKAQMMVMNQAFGDQINIVTVNPFLIGAIIAAIALIAISMTGGRKRRRR
jgi:hypothetical protein